MPKEPISNIKAVCHDHAPRPDPALAAMPLEFFLGAMVKIGFNTHRRASPQTEHMWVSVDRLANPTDPYEKHCELVGTLSNDPMFATAYVNGDTIVFRRDQIEDVYRDDDVA